VLLFWPLPKRIVNRPLSTVLLAEDGQLLGAVLAADEQWRFPEVDSLPYRYKKALITFEDAYFYQHPGINPIALAKAFWANIKAGKVVRGGSTLSMQLARMAYDNRPRTIIQKLKEMVMALRLEAQLSKEEILKLYTTYAPFGSNIEGIQAASYRYFGRAPHALSWAEAALLAVLPNQPAMLFPGSNNDQLIEKRNRLLSKLLAEAIIDSTSYQLAIIEDIPEEQISFPKQTQHLLYNRHQHASGKIHHSTINERLQNRAGDLLNQYVQKLKANQIHNAAALIVDWQKQEVKAYIGNANSGAEHGEDVDIIRSVRSPGSLLKPILYANALNEGLISPKQLLTDIPIFYEGFSPKNFDHQYYGAVKADDALARSLNIPFVNLLRDFGVAPFYDLLKRMGFENLKNDPSHYGLSLILGGAEISPWEIAYMYMQIARGASENIINEDVQLLISQQLKPNELSISSGASWLTLQAMKELQRPGEEFGWERFTSSQEIAWKTGTSFGFRDAWAVGINQRYLAVVWTGNADGEGRPGLVGVRTAAPLLFQLVDLVADDGAQDFHIPLKALKTVKLCTESGYLATQACEAINYAYINKSKKLLKTCPYHEKIFLDESEQYRVNASCYPMYKAKEQSYLVLPPSVAYFYKPHHANFKEIPKWLPDCQSASQPMEMIYPRNFTNIFIPRELDGKEGSAIFELAHQNKAAKVFWYVDGNYVGQTEETHQIAIQSSIGTHEMYVVDESGNYLSFAFNVIKR